MSGSIWLAIYRAKQLSTNYDGFFVHPSGLLRLSYAVVDPQSCKWNL